MVKIEQQLNKIIKLKKQLITKIILYNYKIECNDQCTNKT